MDSTEWGYIASREANKLDVLTSSIEQSQLIKQSLEELGLENSEASLTDRLQFFPEPEKSTLARCFERGTEGSSFYNAVAVYPVAGKILGIRYPEIFDTIYMVSALFADIVSKDEACLDVGTCTGFSALVLNKLGIGAWHGIDRSANCIAYAERCVADAAPDRPPSFKRQDFAKLSKDRKYRLVLNSRGPQMKASEDQYTTVASVLEPGGFLVYVSAYIKNKTEAQKIYSKSGLSLIYRDLVGGWCQATNQFDVFSLSVFTKSAIELPPGDYRSAYEALWSPHFQDYSNNVVTDEPSKKTLCMMREYKRANS